MYSYVAALCVTLCVSCVCVTEFRRSTHTHTILLLFLRARTRAFLWAFVFVDVNVNVNCRAENVCIEYTHVVERARVNATDHFKCQWTLVNIFKQHCMHDCVPYRFLAHSSIQRGTRALSLYYANIHSNIIFARFFWVLLISFSLFFLWLKFFLLQTIKSKFVWWSTHRNLFPIHNFSHFLSIYIYDFFLLFKHLILLSTSKINKKFVLMSSSRVKKSDVTMTMRVCFASGNVIYVSVTAHSNDMNRFRNLLRLKTNFDFFSRNHHSSRLIL